jgi:broad specificity phosphatase PhoE
MESAEQKWPDMIWLVRHGQSAGNVARDAAEQARQPLIDIATRDVDTPLSALGMEQAHALGEWFGAMPQSQRPSVVLSSPYTRALATAAVIRDTAFGSSPPPLVADERLREKEFGILDRMTHYGIAETYPKLMDQRQHVGKFYFRPPGGESWCDVILRLRSVIDTVTREYARERLLIVGHQVIVNCFRYLFERLNEEQILAIDRAADVPNCAVTSYEFDRTQGKRGKLMPRLINFTVPLRDAGAPITVEPDMPAAPKS